jgi:DNA-binding protein HU-beta
VNKRELVAKIATDAHLTRAQAAKALDAFLEGVRRSLENGRRVTLMGFGTFAVSKRKARQVRDPRNGSTMRIEARRVARFAPGVELKDAIDRGARE